MTRLRIEWFVFNAYTVMCAVILFMYVWNTPYQEMRFAIVAFYYICTMLGIWFLMILRKRMAKAE